MSTQIVVPPMGESVSEATVAKWLKKVGDAVRVDEPLVELETDKVTLEVNAAVAGVIAEIKVQQGGNVGVGAVLGFIHEGAAAVSAPTASATTSAPAQPLRAANISTPPAAATAPIVMPAARKQAEDRGIDPAAIPGTGKDGRVTKEDVLRQATQPAAAACASAWSSNASLDSRICCLTRSMSDSGRSTLLTATMIGTLPSWACLMASTVWGMTPSLAATTRITMSVTWAPRARIWVKASWPGVSIKVILPLGV